MNSARILPPSVYAGSVRWFVYIALLGACGDGSISNPLAEAGPVSGPDMVEATITLEFQARGYESDGDGTLTDQHSMSQESQWRTFSSEIDAAFGDLPGDLELQSVVLELLPSSQGVSVLGDIFNGPVGFKFRTTGTGETYSLAVIDVRQESTATEVADFLLDFRYHLIGEIDREQIVGGGTQALFVGQANRQFERTNRVGDLRVSFHFRAFKPLPEPEVDAGL